MVVIDDPKEFSRLAMGDLGLRVFTTFATVPIEAQSNWAIDAGLKFEPGFFCFDAHLARLSSSAISLGIRSGPDGALKVDIFNSVVGALSKKVRALGRLTPTLLVRIVVSSNEFYLYVGEYARPWPAGASVKAITVRAERTLPEYKSTNGAVSSMARSEAAKLGASEGILIDRDGLVREGAWSNFFWFNERGDLCTVEAGVLPGITRGAIIKESSPNLVNISLEDLLKTAKDAFITQATTGITRLASIDGREFKESEEFVKLRDRFYSTVQRSAVPIYDKLPS